MVICALLFTVITYANAQQGGGRMGGTPEERTKRMVDLLTEKLKLSDDQQTKVTAIVTDQTKAMQKAREEAGDNRDGMREKMQTIMKDTDTKINAVLTDDQKTAYRAYLDERMKNRGQGGAMGGPGGNKN